MQTFTLTRSSTGRDERASVSYSASSKTATLRPDQPLAAGWYEARLTGWHHRPGRQRAARGQLVVPGGAGLARHGRIVGSAGWS